MGNIKRAVELIKNSNYIIAFTGAGISVESGIPSFRGKEGLWENYDPKILDLSYFYSHPRSSWMVIKEIFYDFWGKAKPNPAHEFLSFLEKHRITSYNVCYTKLLRKSFVVKSFLFKYLD